MRDNLAPPLGTSDVIETILSESPCRCPRFRLPVVIGLARCCELVWTARVRRTAAEDGDTPDQAIKLTDMARRLE